MSTLETVWTIVAEAVFLTPISIYYWYGKNLSLRRKRILLVVGAAGFFLILIIAMLLCHAW